MKVKGATSPAADAQVGHDIMLSTTQKVQVKVLNRVVLVLTVVTIMIVDIGVLPIVGMLVVLVLAQVVSTRCQARALPHHDPEQ